VTSCTTKVSFNSAAVGIGLMTNPDYAMDAYRLLSGADLQHVPDERIVEVRLFLGERAYQDGRHEDCFDYTEPLQGLAGDIPVRAAVLFGLSSYHLNRSPFALAGLRRAMDRGCEDLEVVKARAEVVRGIDDNLARELYTRAFAGDPGDLQVLRQLISLYQNEPGALLEFIEKYLETCQTLRDGRESKDIFRARVDCVGHQGITGPQLVEALSDYVELLLLLGRAHDAKGAIDEFRGELSTAVSRSLVA